LPIIDPTGGPIGPPTASVAAAEEAADDCAYGQLSIGVQRTG
jgi:hypothetical protein